MTIRHTEAQKIQAIKDHRNGKPVAAICESMSIHASQFYLWKKKYGDQGSTTPVAPSNNGSQGLHDEIEILRIENDILREENETLRKLCMDAILELTRYKENAQKKS